MNAINAENLVKKFSNHLALDNLSLSIPNNCIFGLLGPNGAGKTTFIRILNQITAPDSGTVHINGERLSQKHIARIGYLPEERGLYKKMKVGEQALYLAQLKGLSKHDALKKLKYWFEKFSIQAWWDKKIEELSKGMQQKVQFIITVLHEPSLLIFDEPFSGFDPINANMLKNEILELRKKGATIIFSTHNMASVEEICDNIGLINNSKLILEGHINDIRDKFTSDIYQVYYHSNFNKLESTLTSDYKIIEAKESPNGGGYLKIELLNKDISNNELLKILSSFGQISKFDKLQLNMNEIFIKAVNEAGEVVTEK